jgi:hypothetical protein
VNTQGLAIPETEAQLVAAISVHSPDLAQKVARRFKALRLQGIIGRLPAEKPAPHSLWHSLGRPYRPPRQS